MSIPDNAPAWLIITILLLWVTRETWSLLNNRSESVADQVLKWAEGLQKDISKHTQRIDDLEKDIDELSAHIRRLERENQSLRSWAQALVHQVREAGAEPVPFSNYDPYPDE